MRNISRGELSKKEHYDITCSQGMTSPGSVFRTGKFTTWRIKRGRPHWQQISIALAMMMSVARDFEDFQNSFPNNIITDSGFSGEDLVSALSGFYRATSVPDAFQMLRPVSKEEAIKCWDFYGNIGAFKVKNFTPLLFPDPERFLNARPRKGILPPFMKSVVPYNDFLSGNVILSPRNRTFMTTGSSGRMGL